MKETHSAGGVVLNRKGEVLIVSQRGRSWSLPKGHLEPGEDALAAARREIYEETGLRELTFIKLLGSYRRPKIGWSGGDDRSELKRLTFYLFTSEIDVLEPVDPDNPEARWIDKRDVAAFLTHPKDKEFFLSIMQSL